MGNEAASLDTDELMHLALHATNHDQPEQAIDYLNRLLAISSDNGKAYYLLGAIHAEIGLSDRAVEEITKAVELEPDLPTAHFQLGLLHLTSGRIEEAEQAWKALDTRGEDDPLFIFKRGILHLLRDEFDQCIKDLQTGIKLNEFNENLNDDMRNIIAQAENARLQNPDTGMTSSEENIAAGHRALLSAYQHDDDTEH